MTEKQKKFCIEYLKDLNATQAAIRAGYSKNTATEIGYEYLRKPHIKEYIDKELDDVMQESKSQLKSRILKELKDVSFSDAGISINERDGEIVDVRITDKLKAMEMLGKYLAMWTEKVEHTVNGDVIEALRAKYENK